MPEWGIRIHDNSIFQRIYKRFMEAYEDGENVESISEWLIERSTNYINDMFDAHPFWFALAFAQWKVKSLDPRVYGIVKEIIESGKDADVWQYQAIAERLERERVLQAFLKKISPDATLSGGPVKSILEGQYKETFRVSSPDQQKGLVIYEMHEPDDEPYTAAYLFSATCNFDIFEANGCGWKMEAEWPDDQTLIIKYPSGLGICEEAVDAYIKGRTISINYVPIDE